MALLATIAAAGGTLAARLSLSEDPHPLVWGLFMLFLICGLGFAVSAYALLRGHIGPALVGLLGISATGMLALAGFTALTVGYLLVPAALCGTLAFVLALYVPRDG
jgi:hypothetical protein